MRSLVPNPADDVDVHEVYARDWVETGGVRANMIASADGAASADGRSGGLQTDGDHAVFAALRDLADVVLVGWSTADTEGYRPVTLDADHAAARRRYGLPDALPIAVVSRSLRIDPDHPLLASDGARPFVVTCAASDPAARDRLAGRATVVVCGDDTVDYRALRRRFAEHGLTRVLCEGGPTILGAVLGAGALDELCLTVAPLAAGAGAGRIVAGQEWADGPRPLRLAGLLEEDGALFLRLRADAAR